MRKIWLCLLLLALLGTLLSGCMRRVEAQGYDVYYVEQSAGAASAGHASSSAESTTPNTGFMKPNTATRDTGFAESSMDHIV